MEMIKKLQEENKQLSFLSWDEYIDDLAAELNQNPKSVTFICFRFVYDELVQRIYPFLLKALRNNAKVNIFADNIYSYHVVIGLYTPIRKIHKIKERILKDASTAMMDELESLGAQVKYINKPNFINKNIVPFMKRDHRKLVILKRSDGKEICYFGSTNLAESKSNDSMIKVYDPKIVEAVKYTSKHLDKNKFKDDVEINIYDNFKLLLDTGKHFRSIIFYNAKKLINNANERIVFVSQFAPEIPLMRLLLKASKRGVKIELVLSNENHTDMSSFPYNTVYLLDKFLSRNNANIKFMHSPKGHVHSKILIVDDSCIIGSNNLSFTGIVSGTTELSAQIKDKEFLQNVEKFIGNLI